MRFVVTTHYINVGSAQFGEIFGLSLLKRPTFDEIEAQKWAPFSDS